MRYGDWPTTEMIVDAGMSASTVDHYRRACLEMLAPAVGCDAALMQWAVPGEPMNDGGRYAFEVDTLEQIGDNLDRYMSDGLSILFHATAEQSVAVDIDILDSKRVAELAVTREVIAPLGLGSAMSVALPAGNYGRMVAIVFFRAARARTYPHQARERLRSLVPVLTLGELAVARRSERLKDFSIELSPEEWRLVDWVRRGHSNREIGLVLGVASYTVRNRLSRLYRKLHVASRTELLFALGLTQAPAAEAGQTSATPEVTAPPALAR